MAYELKYDERFAGAKAVSKDGATVETSALNNATVYNVEAGYYYILTGYYYDLSGSDVAFQTTNGMYVLTDLNNPKWTFTQNAESIKTYSDSQAQKLVDKIIENNKTILCNNLLCARFANRFTAGELSAIRGLQNRLQERNNALQAGGLVTDVQTNYPAGYAELSADLDKLMQGEAIGIAVSTVIWIVVACVVAAGTGTAVYYGYKYFADESEKDVKFSKELTATLVSKLTPEEYEQLKAETKGIVTKARIKQSLGSYWNIVKWVAIAFAGYTACKMITQ